MVPSAFLLTESLLVGVRDPLEGRTFPVQMTAREFGVPARVDQDHSTSVAGGLVLERKKETNSFTSQRIEGQLVQLVATTLGTVVHGAEELMEDNQQGFTAVLQRSFSDALSGRRLNERIRGLGGVEPLGVLNSPALISVAKESGQAADTINGANIQNMALRVWNYERAVWLANPDTRTQLAQAAIDTADGSRWIFQPAQREGEPDMLDGRPCFFTEFASALGDKGDLICGVWSEYLDGTLQPGTTTSSVHVRFDRHEEAFKFWTRGDGQPWWLSTLQARFGANTVSPFVTLAERA